ncbi:TLC domain-containing protein [Piptocephalis cylindrospora]|uniref:TLC domain-containing protein n=1 Tax=Piptocephalis cylindrospora TaxID=1907219 RepID=A0A4P9Y1B0_9FUNG|nr:TLC domain-containing protein [Piptocephalis cylindrospora]|eukprot:RKP12555.1 TLC domain-containing protein [Piptocephalis cylindrospora]
MRFILSPLARFSGVRRKLKVDRFAEQAWIVLWASFSLTYGLILMKDAPYWNNSAHFWKDYPHLHYQPAFKFYYIMQAAFWSAQIVVLNIEKPRKDYVEMLLHHLVTISLISLSYTFHLTRVGHAILCITDISDIFLSFAKCLRYAGFTTSCDAIFGIFVLSWVYSRFYLLGRVSYSVTFEARDYLTIGWNPSTGHYLTENNVWIFVFLLSCLMALMIFWFVLIVKVIVRVLGGVGAEDNRSDDEDDGEEEEATDEAMQVDKQE